ncbi:hypothetical protein QWY84_16235 [Aquisalimonas lutea]|uniref:hypothetical protein n=1 Tax=Aquisalimonas lutea TaxID=1327750 RepID=UPI0025B61953|nr:hypothetical protein [Aquisalimonas lutea]MDN3519163.1 hypothetical protein [Aquisalimonas lutea]
MAFHTPDPELRRVELRNAQLRAQAFAGAFRCLRRWSVAMIRCGRRWAGRLGNRAARSARAAWHRASGRR